MRHRVVHWQDLWISCHFLILTSDTSWSVASFSVPEPAHQPSLSDQTYFVPSLFSTFSFHLCRAHFPSITVQHFLLSSLYNTFFLHHCPAHLPSWNRGKKSVKISLGFTCTENQFFKNPRNTNQTTVFIDQPLTLAGLLNILKCCVDPTRSQQADITCTCCCAILTPPPIVRPQRVISRARRLNKTISCQSSS